MSRYISFRLFPISMVYFIIYWFFFQPVVLNMPMNSSEFLYVGSRTKPTPVKPKSFGSANRCRWFLPIHGAMDDFPGNPCGFAGTLCQYFFKSVQKNSFTIYDKKYNITINKNRYLNYINPYFFGIYLKTGLKLGKSGYSFKNKKPAAGWIR